MQLFTLNAFTGRPMCIHNGWRFSADGTMLIEGKDGEELPFKKVTICPTRNRNSSLVLDGAIGGNGSYGLLHEDKKKIRNKNRALLLIVAEGNIHLPDHLYHDHRVRIEPIANKKGSLIATVVCFLKTEDLHIVIDDGQENKDIYFSYDQDLRFPSATDVTVPIHLNPQTAPEEHWWTWLKKEFGRCAYNYFHPLSPWRKG